MASRSWNRVELIGNLTRDPELRYTPNGTAVCTIGLATNRTYVSEGERKEDVDFHRIVAWAKLAELCNQLLKKGSRVFMSGRLQYREWETQDGQKRRDAEIVLEDMLVLTSRSAGGEDVGEDILSAAGLTAPADNTQAAPAAKAADDSQTSSKKEEKKEEPEAESDAEEEKPKTKTAGKAPVDEDVNPDEDLPF